LQKLDSVTIYTFLSHAVGAGNWASTSQSDFGISIGVIRQLTDNRSGEGLSLALSYCFDDISRHPLGKGQANRYGLGQKQGKGKFLLEEGSGAKLDAWADFVHFGSSLKVQLRLKNYGVI
jgi:hypothetical protein